MLLAEDACGHGVQMNAHHCFTTAVHAVHTHTGHIFTMHGERDQRMWEIGSPEVTITWHPIPFRTPEGQWPDVFCAGQVQLADGRLYLAGGNVTGSGTGGGLHDTFLFDPEAMEPASATTCPFGWEIEPDANGVYSQNPVPRLTHDRWYPTLTVLRDGRVLISSGYSRQTPDALGQASHTRMMEVYDPATNTMEQLDNPEALFPDAADKFPSYPHMFLLPNGDVFYAGSEEASNPQEAAGRILIPDYNNGGVWAWDDHVISSEISGGSSVMFAPGKILKTGGPVLGGNGQASDIAEVVDLSTYASGDYASAPSEFSTAAPMSQPRHYHNLTVLPDGRVLAVGGNRFGNSNGADHFNNPCRDPTQGNQPLADLPASNGCYTECIEWNPEALFCDDAQETPSVLRCSLLNAIECEDDATCEAAMPGATCSPGGQCFKDCTALGADPACTPIQGGAVTSPLNPNNCWPHSNECEASYTAEIWDPTCNRWEALGDQDFPRMYHSTALLLPDGRVLSMGGGHRDFGSWRNLREGVISEYFAPSYGSGPRPRFTIGASSDPSVEGPYLPWDGSVEVTIQNDVEPASAVLIRLGSTTHGFDQDQRFVPLGPPSGSGSSFTIPGPASAGEGFHASQIAPPGYYMLFLISAQGRPSIGQYVRVGGETPSLLVCEATPTLVANEVSCSSEPVGGSCPSGSEVTESIALPKVTGPKGDTEGFHVVASPGTIENPAAPTPQELEVVEGLCSQACEAYFADRPGQSANCGSAGAFETPTLLSEDVPLALDLVRDDERQAEGLFLDQKLDCDVGTSCFAAFDEHLASAVPDRVTPAEDALGVGEEYSIALGARSNVEVITNQGTYTSTLTGSVGYSFCAPGEAPCPFYFGSLEAVAASTIYASAKCADGRTERLTLEDLVIRLGQPAFGIADAGSDLKAFPAGGLILDASLSVGREHFGTRRPNRLPIEFDAAGLAFSAQDLDVTVDIPCGSGSHAEVTVRLSVEDPGDGSALGRPPLVAATTPPSVACGTTVQLTANVLDRDQDLVATRWFVDDVLLSKDTTQLVITTSHQLKVVAYDARGAATADMQEISCN